MPAITREKIRKYQEMTPEGWSYDWRYYVMWGENQLQRHIPQDDNTTIEATVRWDEIYETKTNEYGCSWNVKTGEYRVDMNVRRWRPGSTPGTMVSDGIGRTIELDSNGYPRRSYKMLCVFAGAVSDELIIETLTKC